MTGALEAKAPFGPVSICTLPLLADTDADNDNNPEQRHDSRS